MNTLLTDSTTIDAYQLRLPMFEGPLDVLLRLIERSQLAITDVSLVAVTDQFLDLVGTLGVDQPTVLAEFTAIGSRLVLLKSRSLLPRPELSDDEYATDDLVHQLIEYRAVREAALQLGQRDVAGEGAYARGSGAVALPKSSVPPRLAMHDAASLARAIKRRLSVIPAPSTALPTCRIVSLREMVERLLRMAPERGPIRFSRVRTTCEHRQDVLTAFLALLVLIRRRVVDAEQTTPFGEIDIRKTMPPLPVLHDSIAGQAADD